MSVYYTGVGLDTSKITRVLILYALKDTLGITLWGVSAVFPILKANIFKFIRL